MPELSDADVFGGAVARQGGGRELSDDEVFAGFDASGPGLPTRKKKSLALGFYRGVTKPLDNVAMAIEAGAQRVGIPTDRVNLFMGMPSASEAADQHRRAVSGSRFSPAASGQVAGEIVGTLPTMAATKNPFVQGALQGAALTDKRDPVGVGMDAAGGAAVNWFGGKVMDKVADTVAPVIEPAVRRLSDAGVKLTPGMVKGGKAMAREDKRMSRPVVGDVITAARQKTQDTFNRATLDEALKPLGMKVPAPVKTGHDAVDWAHTEVSRAYDTIVPNLAVNLNGQQFAAKLAPVAATLPTAQRKEFQRLLSLHLKNGQLQGQELKNAQGEVRRLSAIYGRSQVAADQELGRALSQVDDELSAEMLAQNPKWAPELQKVNTAYRGLMVVEGAAKGADEGVFNTGQLKTSVRQGDRSKGKSQTARGNAFMQGFSEDARAVIPARTPDSGTAGRNQAANLFARLGGAADAAGFKAEEIMAQISLLPRSQQAAALAAFMRKLGPAAGAGAVALTSQSGN